jgi:hypothetical protein
VALLLLQELVEQYLLMVVALVQLLVAQQLLPEEPEEAVPVQ